MVIWADKLDSLAPIFPSNFPSLSFSNDSILDRCSLSKTLSSLWLPSLFAVNVLFPVPPLATAAGSTNPDRVLCLLLSALTLGFLLVLSVVFPTELLFEVLHQWTGFSAFP